MINKFFDTLKQIVNPFKKRKSAKQNSQDSLAILRNNQIVKPAKANKSDVIAPTQYDITPQAAKSLLRKNDYIHVQPRDTYAIDRGDL